jgi:hypothetical protein
MGRFAKALVGLVSSTIRASSALMEQGAQKLSDYADKHRSDPPETSPEPRPTV